MNDDTERETYHNRTSAEHARDRKPHPEKWSIVPGNFAGHGSCHLIGPKNDVKDDLDAEEEMEGEAYERT